jgi:hypothetical protein
MTWSDPLFATKHSARWIVNQLPIMTAARFGRFAQAADRQRRVSHTTEFAIVGLRN